MIEFILFIVLFLLAAFSWAAYVNINSEGNKFISLLPYWVLGYGISLALFCPVSFFGVYGTAGNVIFNVISAISLAFACLVIACFIVCLIKKQYRNSGRTVGIGLILIVYTLIVIMFAGLGEGSFDNFGKRHPIPQSMKYEKPIEEEFSRWYRYSDSEKDSIIMSRGLILSGDCGMYRYMAFIPPMDEEGDIYLKMYEATTDFPLSEGIVKRYSTIHVSPSKTAKIYKMPDGPFSVTTKDYFTIREGSWGDFYAARAELWFQPKNGNEPRMLKSKIFRIEGFSR